MSTNPVIRPKLATPTLVLASATALIALISFLVALTSEVSFESLTFATLVLLPAAITVGAIWLARLSRRNAWNEDAEQKWHDFDNARNRHGTTTEITVLSVDALEPTGSWITINWNRFDHIQPAWIEALPEQIWPGSVLLMRPDPGQVSPGKPWPQTYYIRASDLLAWAPAERPNNRLRKAPVRARP